MDLVLDSVSLLSKFGFNDGDCPEWVVEALVDGSWDDDHPGWGVNSRHVWQPILRALVLEYLVPLLPEPVSLIEWDDGTSMHNPVMAQRSSTVPEGIRATVPEAVVLSRCRSALALT